MRVLITVNCTLDRRELENILHERRWFPGVPEEHESVQAFKAEIIASIPKEQKKLVEATHRWTLYKDIAATPGTVSEETAGQFTFRFKHRDSIHLRQVTELLLSDLDTVHRRRWPRGTRRIEFEGQVRLLEHGSGREVVVGEYIRASWRRALRERRKEAQLAGYMALFTIVAIVASYPFGATEPVAISGGVAYQGSPILDWWRQLAGRIGTAALIAGVISWIEVAFHYYSLRRHQVVRWEPK